MKTGSFSETPVTICQSIRLHVSVELNVHPRLFIFTSVLCAFNIFLPLILQLRFYHNPFLNSLPRFSSVISYTSCSTLSSTSERGRHNIDAVLHGHFNPHVSAYLTQNKGGIIATILVYVSLERCFIRVGVSPFPSNNDDQSTEKRTKNEEMNPTLTCLHIFVFILFVSPNKPFEIFQYTRQ